MSGAASPNPAGDTPTVGTSQFASANSQTVAEGQDAANPESPAPTANRRLKLKSDEKGAIYLLDPVTGTRYDVSDDETILPGTPPERTRRNGGRNQAPLSDGEGQHSGSPSSPSDVTSSTGGDVNITSEALLALLVTDLSSAPLTDAQSHRFHTLRGILTLGRDSLMTTTGLVAGQRDQIRTMSDSLREFRDEVANRFDEFSDAMISATHSLENTLENNGAGRSDPIMAVNLPPLAANLLPDPVDLGDVRPDIDRVIPPKRDTESYEEFQRRGNAALARRARAAAAFDPNAAQPANPQPASILKATRFASVGSASRAGAPSGPARNALVIEPVGLNQTTTGYHTPRPAGATTITAFEAFALEKSAQIERIIERQLGEAMEAPPRAPKLKDPPMYKGEDNDEYFMSWLTKMCTWMQGYSLGGPRYDANRIVYLKTALDSHALEWFDNEVEPTDRESDIDHEFAPIICALHKRFVTSATATRATKEYEAVRYDAARGIEFLASELLRTANKMREPPSDFSIRQRFMRLIPAAVHDKLIERGLFPEYADLTTLKSHARVWIEALEHMRGAGDIDRCCPRWRSTSHIGNRAAQAPARAAQTINSRAATKATSTPMYSSPAGPSTSDGPPIKVNKTCYACGIYGHTSADPVCPRFNESASARPKAVKLAPRPAAQLHAQRVLASYSVDGEEVGVNEADTRDPDHISHLEEDDGLWGGDQYSANELIDDYPADDEGEPEQFAESTEVRVGAMRQYFSLRVEPPPEGNTITSSTGNNLNTGPPTRRAPARTLLLDSDVLIVGVAGDGYIPWSAEEDARIAADRMAGWDMGATSHEGLLTAFDAHYGSGPYTGPALEEMAAVEAVGAEEHARALWDSLMRMQPLMIVGFSSEFLRTTAIDVEGELATFMRMFTDLQQTLIDLAGLQSRRLLARTHLHTLRERPTGSSSRAPRILHLATMANRRLLNDMRMSIHILEQRLTRIATTRTALEEELTRRLVERESWALNQSVGPSPSRGSSPPSYPGSPHESDEYYSPDEQPYLSRVPGLASNLVPGPTVTSMADPIADSPTEGSDLTSSATSSIGDSGEGGWATAGGLSTAEGELNDSTVDLPNDANQSAPNEEIVLRSIEVITSREAERLTTVRLPNGELRTDRSPLPPYHRRHPQFQDEHQEAMRVAISDRAQELDVPQAEVERWVEWESRHELNTNGDIIRTTDGFPDQYPNNLFSGLVYHEGLASSGPENDDETAWPGFRAQILAQRIEHIATVRRPRTLPPQRDHIPIGLMDQPTRSNHTIACLSALVKIGSTSAYVLFDSGSNTDSMTPEYANAINGVRIPLTEQVTLQLGCVGSRSKISFGTRVPVDFGGVKGHVYFDQVNLDRYDVVIGTPFMNRHGVVLDFGQREIRFPRGHVIKALSTLEEASLVDEGGVRKHRPGVMVETVEDEDSYRVHLPSLSCDAPFVLIAEHEYMDGLHSPPITDNHSLRRAHVREEEDSELSDALPSLPWWHPCILIPEEECEGIDLGSSEADHRYGRSEGGHNDAVDADLSERDDGYTTTITFRPVRLAP
ncbi:Retrovirus-related Pol polyprotein from transposon 412 [Mycena venus]|uniref:Retrovirus-related Pol polyprotein from transposon 412 n=1 Tax=Mycena venus TaxID=2733690 RepID=A0A8H6X5E5_9AGAR|nr:Retrovirus-related Pol polyprotein from transposon 412 [Mycena venus]